MNPPSPPNPPPSMVSKCMGISSTSFAIRVSMGLTDSRKRAKNLVDSRKN